MCRILTAILIFLVAIVTVTLLLQEGASLLLALLGGSFVAALLFLLARGIDKLAEKRLGTGPNCRRSYDW